MAYLEYKECSVCGEMMNIYSHPLTGGYNSTCDDCWIEEQKKKKQNALSKVRDGKTLEERVAFLEERLLLLEEEERQNSSFRNLHIPIR